MASKNVTAGNINIAIKVDSSTVNASTEDVKQSFKKLSESSVSSMQATSASLRLLEGGIQNNLRAAEKWISSFSTMRALAQAAEDVRTE